MFLTIRTTLLFLSSLLLFTTSFLGSSITLCLICSNIFVFITMELWYSLVIGTVVFFYIQFFNANAKAWLGKWEKCAI
jgi:hypothetical protein